MVSEPPFLLQILKAVSQRRDTVFPAKSMKAANGVWYSSAARPSETLSSR
jgi:hypothetical protein